ncbi:hypothetical protein HPB47_005649 [Ixodes persulcatus]|uniref:Uncharacterized protein n=1 Tax=Ixodes persulcatus TaxID=34615 RepID=A0AC60PD94_IXOPE|nr:hypothetical protein HPB47_005649 [Ixodes persulcatus]
MYLIRHSCLLQAANVDHQYHTLRDDLDTVFPNGHRDGEGDDNMVVSYSAYAVDHTLQVVLPQDIVDKFNLPSQVVHLWPVKELLAHDRKNVFKLASHLTDTHVVQGHFDKMKELVREGKISRQALTTAWFFKMVNRRFDLMCSRHPGMALRLIRPERHAEAVAFLEFFMDLFLGVKIEYGTWKPYLKTHAHTSYFIDDGAFFLADYRAATPQEMRELVEGTASPVCLSPFRSQEDPAPRLLTKMAAATLLLPGFVSRPATRGIQSRTQACGPVPTSGSPPVTKPVTVPVPHGAFPRRDAQPLYFPWFFEHFIVE